MTKVTLVMEGPLERAASEGDADAVGFLSDWRKAWALPEGSAFRNPQWSEAKSAALAALRAGGYATAAWTGTNAEVDTQTHTVSVFVVVDSGPQFRYGSLQIEGLVAHDKETVGNLFNARRGSPITETMLLDFQERLQKAGLFAGVSVTLDTSDPTTAGNANVVARLGESALQDYTFGIGVSAGRAIAGHIGAQAVMGTVAAPRLRNSRPASRWVPCSDPPSTTRRGRNGSSR